MEDSISGRDNLEEKKKSKCGFLEEKQKEGGEGTSWKSRTILPHV